jgi:hypothetical protein
LTQGSHGIPPCALACRPKSHNLSKRVAVRQNPDGQWFSPLSGEINPLFPEVVDHLLWDDIQKSEYSIITKFSRILYKMLVDYKKFSGKGVKEPCPPVLETSNRPCRCRGRYTDQSNYLLGIYKKDDNSH